MYKKFEIKGVEQPCVIRLSDNAFIPFAPDNTDYQAYLKFLAEGNSPYPADSATPEPAENT